MSVWYVASKEMWGPRSRLERKVGRSVAWALERGLSVSRMRRISGPFSGVR